MSENKIPNHGTRRGERFTSQFDYVNFGAPVTSKNVMGKHKVDALLSNEKLTQYYIELYDIISVTPPRLLGATIKKFVEKKFQTARNHDRHINLSLLALEELTGKTPAAVQASLLEKLTILASTARHNAQLEYPSTQYAFTIDGHRITGEDIKAKAQQIADWTEPEVLARKRSYFLAIASDRNESYIDRFHAYQDLVKVADRYEELGYTQEYLILANEINEITQELLRIKEEQLRTINSRRKPQPTTEDTDEA